MPQIKPYEAPEGIGLHPSETGIQARAGAARRVQTGYNEIAGGIEKVGHAADSAIQIAGKVATQYMEHEEISRNAAVFARKMAADNQQWDEIVKQESDAIAKGKPADPTIKQRYLDSLEQSNQEFQGAFLTEKGTQWAQSHIITYRQHMFNKTTADMASVAGHAAMVEQRQVVNGLSTTVRGDPASLDFALNTLDSTIEAKIESSPHLRGAAAVKVTNELRQQGKESIVKSAAFGYIEKTGEIPDWASDPKYAPYITGAEIKQFQQAAKYYKRQNELSDRAVVAEQRNHANLSFNSDINNLELSLYDENGNPQAGPQHVKKLNEIVKSNPLGAAQNPGRVRSMQEGIAAVISRVNKPEPDAKISHAAAVELIQRIRSDDDTKITDMEPIYQELYNGNLSKADFKFVTDEFRSMRSADGEKIGEVKRELFRNIGPAIDKSNPLLGKLDPDGKMNMYRFERDLNKKIDLYRRTPGKDVWDLFDPSKPDYVGSPAALAPYQKSMDQSAADIARRLGTRPAPKGDREAPANPPVEPVRPPRKPGETPDAYLKRIGVN